MKKIGYLYIGLLLSIQSLAQSITAFKYWFDTDSPVTVTGSFGSNFELNLQLATTGLPAGLHTYTIGFQDNTGLWSSFTSSFFYKTNDSPPAGQAQYEYWFDNDYANKVNTNITATNNLELLQDLNTDALSTGLHTINMRFKPDGQHWSSAISSFFYKANTSNGTITQYNYWFDNDYANKVTINITGTNSLNLNTALNTSSLSTGLHVLHTQYKQSNGLWSSATSDFFVKEKGVLNNGIVKIKYWFDNNQFGYRELTINNQNPLDFIGDLDADRLTDGKHYLYLQFKDKAGKYSSVLMDSLIKIPTTSRLYKYPNITLGGTVFNASQNIQINGRNFQSLSQVQVKIISINYKVQADTLITANQLGEINFPFSQTNITSGEYYIQAVDKTTLFSSNQQKLKIINIGLSTSGLKMLSPVEIVNSRLGTNQQVLWSDFGDGNISIFNNTATAKVPYRIEKRVNSGPWVQVGIKDKFINYHKSNTLSESLPLEDIGNVQYRISRNLELSRTDTTAKIIITPIVSGIKTTLEWDSSGHKFLSRKPIGLCAEGTSRIFIKVGKESNNNKVISSVQCVLQDNGITEKRLLGKVMSASSFRGYLLEGNNANSIVASKSIPNEDGNFWFWYVAPDDFPRSEADNLLSERTVIVEITVNYSNGSQETSLQNISIIRPPLVLVHGIFSSPETWANFRFKSGVRYFNYADLTTVGKVYKFPVKYLTMDKSASFYTNARTLLDLKDGNVPALSYNANSIQNILFELRLKNYACNKVDYVGHSMGGSVGRAAISLTKYYIPSSTENVLYKNYEKGFFNKFITISTPHNGAPFANFGVELLNTINQIPNVIFQNNNYNLGTMALLTNVEQYNLGNAQPFPAIYDLQSGTQGVRFGISSVKNHLIGGDFNIGISDCNQKMKVALESFNFTPNEQISLAKNSIETILKIYKIGSELKKKGLEIVIDSLLNDKLKEVLIENPLIDINTYIWKENFINSFCLGGDILMEDYGYPNFFNNSDIIVPLKSQFANKTFGTDSTLTRISGVESLHTNITSSLEAGTKVFDLINRPINSNQFADEIPASVIYPTINSVQNSKNLKLISVSDSVIFKTDTLKIKIISPMHNYTISNNDFLEITVELKDTTKFKKLDGQFIDYNFISISKAKNQTFRLPIKNQVSGKIYLVIKALHDSLGFFVFHQDTLSVRIPKILNSNRLVIEPDNQDFGIDAEFLPSIFEANASEYSQISINDPDITFAIADTSVIKYNTVKNRFVSKSRGTTYITFTKAGISEKFYAFVSNPFELCDLGEQQNLTALKTGDWTDPDVWPCGIVPTISQNIEIPDNYIITIPDNQTGFAKHVNVSPLGKLVIKPSGNLRLGE